MYGGQPQQMYGGQPQQMYGGQPQQIYGGQPQQIYGGQPQQMDNQQQYQSQPTPYGTPPQYVPSSYQTIVEQPLGQPFPPQPVEQSQATAKQNGAVGGIYGDHMEHLIEMALADGELTEKEKQVLFKKATDMGIDLDEFEMVLEARLYERRKSMKPSISQPLNAAPKSERLNDVRKCPACGAIVESFTTKCPDCGHEFRNVGTVSSFEALTKKLNYLESQKLGANKEDKWYQDSKYDIESQKVEMINNFPVPTAKEDLLEFLTMASGMAKKSGFFVITTRLEDAWWNKCKQVIYKARISMKGDILLEDIEKIAKKLKID